MGFTLAAVGVIGLVKTVTTAAVLLPYLILAVPILDMSAVILTACDRVNLPSLPISVIFTTDCCRQGFPTE